MNRRSVAIVTSIHPDFDSRVWKHAKGLARAGYDVHFVCPWKVENGATVDGVRFHTFTRVTNRALRSFQIPSRILARLLPILGQVQLVHFHDLDILPWMMLLSFFKPVVYDVHENYPEEMMVRDWIPRPFRHLLRFGVYWIQLVCSMKIRNIVLVAPSYDSGFTSPYLRRIYFRNLATLDLVKDVAPDYLERPPAVIFTGSQYENNGSLLYLEIAAICKQSAPELPFYVTDRFASAAFKNRVLAIIEQKQLTNIQFLPNVKPHELMHTMNRATIAVSPSLRVPQQVKGFHTKLYEYMAAGLPMVASDLPHESELIGKNNCGILARPEEPESFAAAILRLARDPGLAFQMGQNGQTAFKNNYSWETELPKLLDFYDRILEKPAAAYTLDRSDTLSTQSPSCSLADHE
jgi:glycosyltransferase involved in cell wall biosynthesis